MIKKIIEAIYKKKSFLISSHINLEGDALGSELALAKLLKRLKKKALILNADKSPEEYMFLPRIKLIRNTLNKFRFDIVIILDCAEYSRIGRIRDFIPRDSFIINIDHHISNTRFGTINWIDKNASSTSEMIFSLYKRMQFALDKEVALYLYTGIFSDTGSFRYPNTTSRTHKIISEILKVSPLNVYKIYRHIYGSYNFSDAKFLISVLSTLKKDPSGKIVWFELTKDILKNKKYEFDQTENILNFGRLIKGVELIILFREKTLTETRVNFRSNGKFNVAKLAEYFGGGGHYTASGCNLNYSLEKTKRIILTKAKKDFNL